MTYVIAGFVIVIGLLFYAVILLRDLRARLRTIQQEREAVHEVVRARVGVLVREGKERLRERLRARLQK